MRTPVRVLTRALVPLAAAVAGVLLLAGPASAAVPADKPAVLSSFTQPTSASHSAWDYARTHQSTYAAYAFDWSTDYCSDSPDQPLGFDFRMPCWRHDFGYRNYKAIGTFSANKSHVDDAFYFDLKAKCATYNVLVRPACDGLAWTYYQAVKTFGALHVTNAQVRQYEALKAAG